MAGFRTTVNKVFANDKFLILKTIILATTLIR